jgi:hypothetical protein
MLNGPLRIYRSPSRAQGGVWVDVGSDNNPLSEVPCGSGLTVMVTGEVFGVFPCLGPQQHAPGFSVWLPIAAHCARRDIVFHAPGSCFGAIAKYRRFGATSKYLNNAGQSQPSILVVVSWYQLPPQSSRSHSSSV